VLFLVGAGACLLTFLFARGVQQSYLVMAGKPLSARAGDSGPGAGIQLQKYERLVYPYSVIPGGVRNREELLANIKHDPVVASHFADFVAGQARMVTMEVTKSVYVSYRLKNQVFWTSKPVKIPQGETLITDGRDYARARCGNRISVLPQAPVAEEEPEPESFDIPMLAKLEPVELPSVPEPRLELREFAPVTPYFPMPAPKVLPFYYRPLFVISPRAEVIVPEPGTSGLLLLGLAGIIIFWFIRKK